jgi:hypothetical protein
MILCDTMGERIGRIRRIRTDFLIKMHGFQAKKQKKSVSICRIRPIRSPIVSQSIIYYHKKNGHT